MIEDIKKNKILQGVQNETLVKIMEASSSVITVQSGDNLIEPENEDTDIFFILSGSVRLSLISQNGDVVSYKDVQENDIFGWLSILDNKERLTSAVVQETSNVIKINGQDFKEILYSDKTLMENFMMRIASVIRDYTQRIEKLSVLSVKDRIVSEILKRQKDGKQIITLGTHEDFSSWLGVKRETVTRVLRELEISGTIKKVEGGYELLN